jgi:hypothetical protein
VERTFISTSSAIGKGSSAYLGRGEESKPGLCSSCVTLPEVEQRRIPFPFRPRNDPSASASHLLVQFTWQNRATGMGQSSFDRAAKRSPHPVELAQFKCSGWRDHARVKRPEKRTAPRHIWEAELTPSPSSLPCSPVSMEREAVLREMTLQRSYLFGHGRSNARRCPLAKENPGLSDDSRRAHYASFRRLRYSGAEPLRYPFCWQRYLQISSSFASYVEG